MSNAPAVESQNQVCNAQGGTYRCQRDVHPSSEQHACVAGVVINQPKVSIFRWGGGQNEQWIARKIRL